MGEKQAVRQRVLVLVVVCAMLDGCSSLVGGGKAMTSSKLVTAADAERILGGPARLVQDFNGPADSIPGASESRCEYVGPDRATLNVVVDTAPSEDRARDALTESRTGLGSFERIEQLSGIGDEAFLSRGPTARRLVVRKKAVVFLLDARRDNDPEATVDEMKKTATRMAGQV